MDEVVLRIGDTVFKAKKELLCEYSDYFRAMFSGFYVESKKQEINIDMLDPDIMAIILQYMQMGMILLSEYPLSKIGEIAVAANFLQITELTKQIEYVLDIQLSECNWVETMAIAQNASFSELEQYSAAYGLYSFSTMTVDHIPTMQKLVWYLSHPYLDARNELEVFLFGFNWLCKHNKLDDAVLILACLDMTRVTYNNLVEIKRSMHTCPLSDSLFLEITDCLLYLTSKDLKISESSMHEHKMEFCEKFSERVWSETVKIINSTRPRCIKYLPVVPLWVLKDARPALLPHNFYTFDEDKGFEQYLEVAEKSLWGWNVAAWGLTKLVIVGGEHGWGSGVFNRDVKVYDTLRKKWTQFGVQLPPRRHAGVTVVGDLLYIIGGVGEFRIVLDTAVIYDLKERSCRSIANFPDCLQSPAVCTHNNRVYAAGYKNIYVYKTVGDRDSWEMVVSTQIRMTSLISYDGYVYCSQSYFRRFYRFKPYEDKESELGRTLCDLEVVGSFSNLPSNLCNLGNRLMVFTHTEFDELTVEEYRQEGAEQIFRVLLSVPITMRVNKAAGSCSVVMTVPPLCTELPQYHTEYLTQHTKT